MDAQPTQASSRPRDAIMAALRQMRHYLALSRAPHCLLDLATPLLAALIYLGGPPPPGLAALAVLTALAGYAAVYAVNDIVDCRTDRANRAEFENVTGYLDGLLMRHPLAQGALTMRQALAWAGGWGAVSLVGAWLLNPVCAGLLLAGAALEAAYCLLLKVSSLRALVNGVVKTLGGLAAVVAVAPHPSPAFVAVLFLALFCWEIGGQNIPADWFDLELDRRQGARTLPLVLGPGRAARLALGCLTVTTALGAALFALSPAGLPWWWVPAALVPGLWLLVRPAAILLRRQDRVRAAVLFNRASYYPLALLASFSLWLSLPG